MNQYLMSAAIILAEASAGAEMFSNDLTNRAKEKWQKSKSLPRKQKKLMRKDALLDLQFAQWSDETSQRLFSF